MSSHIVRSYDAEFSELDRMTAQMGGLAEKLMADAFGALSRRDPKLAEIAAANDREIDRIERQLQERAITMIARRQPMANDLRHIMTVLKIASDLERVGDLAKNIAKRAMVISSESYPQTLINGLKHMMELALRQTKDVLDAFGTRDSVKADAVWRGDAGLDALYNSVFRELLTYMMEDPRNITGCTHLLFIAKNVERMGDHATNIAETVHYQVKGTKLPDDRPKGNDPSFAIAEGHD